jgi:hypothetical protein
VQIKQVEITRLEIAIPYNENTYQKIGELRDYIVRIFGGLTHSKIVYPSPFAGTWRSPEGSPLTEDVVLFILYFSLEENPQGLEVLKAFGQMLLETGEIETWLVFQNASCYKCY